MVELGLDIHYNDEYLLRKSCVRGHLDIVKFLIENGVDVNYNNNEALKTSYNFGHLDIVKYLVKNDVAGNMNFTRALMDSVKNGNLEMVKYFIEIGGKIKPNFLKFARDRNHVEVVEYLKSIMSDDYFKSVNEELNTGVYIKASNRLNKLGYTSRADKMFLHRLKREKYFSIRVLDHCLTNNYIESLKYIIKVKDILNNVERLNRIIDYIERLGLLEILEYLVELGLDISKYGENILKNSSSYGNLNIVKYIIGKGIDIHYNNDIALRIACFHGRINIVEYLIKKGVDVNVQGGNALLGSIISGHFDIAKLLIENGINDNVMRRCYPDVKESGDKKLIKYFNDYFKSVNEELNIDTYWRTADKLDKLGYGDRSDEIYLHMLKRSSDINLNTELRNCASDGKIKCVSYLIDQGARVVLERGDEDNNALAWSAAYGHLDIVKKLLDIGTDIHIGNDSALRYACLMGKTEMVIYLIERGGRCECI